jgi:hypothetical protein
MSNGDQVRKVLGRAVHPKAIDRLLELWPEAYVEVTHYSARHDGVPLRCTRVHIWSGPSPTRTNSERPTGSERRTGTARCRLDCDVWDRRRGIDLAFRRALKKVKGQWAS